MRSCWFSIFMLLLTMGGCATVPGNRLAAQAMLGRLQTSPPPERLRPEFRSIEATFRQGETLQRQGKSAAAARYYQLTLLKGELYTRQLAETADRLAHSTGNQPLTPIPAEAHPGIPPRKVPVVPPPLPPTLPAPPRPQPTASLPTITEPALTAPLPHSDMLAGSESVYVVQKGDFLELIGAKLGISWPRLARQNGLNPAKLLHPGQQLKYSNRKILPTKVQNGIIINIPDLTLYFFNEGKLVRALPVTLGKSEADNAVWQTPTGRFRIVEKEKNPAWHVPKSIREQLAKEGNEVREVVPPGDDNPLGKYALRTSIPGILIHSTNIPASIYGYGSHGCIRVFPEQMEELFKEVKVNTAGEIIYQPVKVAVTDDGRVFLEVHRDVYKKSRDLAKETRRLLTDGGIAERVSWDKVEAVLKKRSGIPEDVGL